MQKARLSFRLVCYFANLKVSGNRKALLPATKAERKKKPRKLEANHWKSYGTELGWGEFSSRMIYFR